MVTKPHILSTVTVSNLTSRILPISGGLRLQPGQTRTVNIPSVQIQEEMVPRLNALQSAGMVTYYLTPGSPADIGNAGGVVANLASTAAGKGAAMVGVQDAAGNWLGLQTIESILAAVAAIGSLFYGSGDDGIAIFDGTNTFPFATKLGNVYTLTRDTYLDGMGTSTVTAGVTLNTASCKLFANGTLLNNGLICNDGKAAVGGTAGGTTSSAGTLGIGTSGGNGRANLTGLPGATQAGTLGDASMAGGAGGAGGVNAGGAGGIYLSTPADGGADWLLPIMSGFIFRQTSGGNRAQLGIIGGGAGGGGGGSDNGGVTGGGGGGGGGVLAIHVLRLINNGIIRCAGGLGAAASGAGGNGGGGGGGGGGMILSVSRFRSGSGTMVCPGGLGGAPIGTGVAGSTGNDGHVNALQG